MKKICKIASLLLAVLMVALTMASCKDNAPVGSLGSNILVESEASNDEQSDLTQSQVGENEDEPSEESEIADSSKEDEDMDSSNPNVSRPEKTGTSSKKTSSGDKVTATSSKKTSNTTTTSSKKPTNTTTTSSKKSTNTTTTSSKKPTNTTTTSSKAPSTSTSSNSPTTPTTPTYDIYTYSPVDTSGMTELQKAVVLTAESYFARGARLQYEDTRLTSTKYFSRWRWGMVRQKTIEDYTTQNIGYSNCAAFTHDVYYNALGFNIEQYTTASLVASSAASRVVLKKTYMSISTNKQKEALKEEFLSNLEPGDLMVYLTSSGSGHVMLYVGNDMMIHCSGSNYDWENKKEVTDIGIRYESIDCLFDESHRRCLYKQRDVAIIRPLNDFNGTIPAATLDRMDEMRGVVAEKLASVDPHVTVNPGDEITFTFNFENLSSTKKTLKVTDVVPANTTYVSGAEKKSGDNLSWTVTVEAGKSAKVSYKVKVAEGALGKTVYGTDAKVENIPVKCHKIYVKNTLTASEQTKIKNAAKALGSSSLRDIALADAIYKEALGESNLTDATATDMLNGIFVNYSTNMESWPSKWKKFTTSTSNKYYKMMAPDLYGGRQVLVDKDYDRATLITANKLVVGDIIITNNPTADTYEDTEKKKYIYEPVNYMFLGDKLLDLTNMKEIDLEPKLEQLLCEKHFVVIRPSITL